MGDVMERRDWGVMFVAKDWGVINVDPLDILQTIQIHVLVIEGFTLWQEEWAGGGEFFRAWSPRRIFSQYP